MVCKSMRLDRCVRYSSIEIGESIEWAAKGIATVNNWRRGILLLIFNVVTIFVFV